MAFDKFPWLGAPIITALLVAMLSTGCVGMQEGWNSYPRARDVKNPYFEAQLKPAHRYGDDQPYHGFFLYIKNLSRAPLEIDWEKTYYIQGRKNRGGFIVGDGVPRDRPYFPSPPRRINPGNFFQDTIWPEYLATPKEGDPDDYEHRPFKPGTHGVYLTVIYPGLQSAPVLPPQPDEDHYLWEQALGPRPPYRGSEHTEEELSVYLPLSIVRE